MEDLTTDEILGALIKRRREDKGWTQAEYAARLSEYGSTWHQQTILKVEKGTRPLRVSEFMVHAHVLGEPASLLMHVLDAHHRDDDYVEGAEGQEALHRVLMHLVDASAHSQTVVKHMNELTDQLVELASTQSQASRDVLNMLSKEE